MVLHQPVHRPHAVRAGDRSEGAAAQALSLPLLAAATAWPLGCWARQTVNAGDEMLPLAEYPACLLVTLRLYLIEKH